MDRLLDSVFLKRASSRNMKTPTMNMEVTGCVFFLVVAIGWVHFVEEDHDTLSVFWEALVMSLLGEALDPADNITGARVIDKSNPGHNQINYRVEVWFGDWSNEEFKTHLQEELAALLKKCGCKATDISMQINDTNKYAK